MSFKNNKKKFDFIATEIEKKIINKQYVSSQKIPSEYELAMEFDCSRLTVRKAIEYLVDKNILIKVPGKGAYIKVKKEINSKKRNICKYILSSDINFQIMIENELQNVSFFLKNIFELSNNKSVYYMNGKCSVNDELIGFCDIYSIKKVKAIDLKSNYTNQEIESSLADEWISKCLGISKGSPILKLHIVGYSNTGYPTFYKIYYCDANEFYYKDDV
ncbi:GntR family transcriptional regulator [Enterococcus sp. DIV1420a]|jgi:GntR family transcriptional regulator|uniref:GntR family transcriptional regulator n=1 Tax=Enterococcus sp. DIV1420a TaxID=2774672 RepID=UPI0036D5A43F